MHDLQQYRLNLYPTNNAEDVVVFLYKCLILTISPIVSVAGLLEIMSTAPLSMTGDMFTHFLYCSVLSLGCKVNTRRMFKRSINHAKFKFLI